MTARRNVKRGGPPSGGPLRVLGYGRVSTEEQGESGGGMGAQRQAITDSCQARGFELLEMVEDVASGKSLARPGITRVLDMLDAGQADALLVAKLDRLSRSLVDFGGLLERARRRGWAVIALDLGVDTTTAAGELVAGVMMSVSQWERKVIGERTRDALAVKKAQGIRLGRPATLPTKIVRRIVRERERGASLDAIAAGLNRDRVPTSQGGAKWYGSTVAGVLKSEAARAL